jgi:hypothetical protein
MVALYRVEGIPVLLVLLIERSRRAVMGKNILRAAKSARVKERTRNSNLGYMRGKFVGAAGAFRSAALCIVRVGDVSLVCPA